MRTDLLRYGVELARNGAWLLLDALEVIERAKTDADFIGILHSTGSPALAGYSGESYDSDVTEVDCPACSGEGCLYAHGDNGQSYRIECPECEGAGEVDADDEYFENARRSAPASDVGEWRTLNDAPAAYDASRWPSGVWINLDKAKQIVREQSAALAARQETKAVEPEVSDAD